MNNIWSSRAVWYPFAQLQARPVESQLLGDEQNQWSLTNEKEFKHQFQGKTQRKPDRLLHSSCSPATTLLLNIKNRVHAEKTSVLTGRRSPFVAITQDTKCFFVTSWFSQKRQTSILMHGSVTSQCPGGAGFWCFASYHEFGKHELLQAKPKSTKKMKAIWQIFIKPLSSKMWRRPIIISW